MIHDWQPQRDPDSTLAAGQVERQKSSPAAWMTAAAVAKVGPTENELVKMLFCCNVPIRCAYAAGFVV